MPSPHTPKPAALPLTLPRLLILLSCLMFSAASCDEDTSQGLPSSDTESTPDTNPPTDTSPDPTDTSSAQDTFVTAPDTKTPPTPTPPDTADAADTNDPSDAVAPTDAVDAADMTSWPPPVGMLRLNEVQCAGSEWVELFNADPSGEPGSLEGWFITDRPGDPSRYYALHGNLRPTEFIVFSEQSAEIADGYEFKLDCDTETLFLIDSENQVQDSIRLDAEASGEFRAFGRLPDGDGPWIATNPTPGQPNQAAVDPLAELFNPLLVHTVDLTIPALSLNQLDTFPREYAEATFTFTPANSTATTAPQSIGVRIKGRLGSFRTFDQKPALKLRFNWLPDGPDTFLGLERLTLNNMVQDPSNIHEWAAYKIFREVGVPAPRTGYVWLRVNGEPYGLYANIETMDALALANHFPSTQHLYEGSYGQDLRLDDLFNLEVDEGSETIRTDLSTLIQTVESTPDETFYETLDPLVNWETTLTNFAVEQFIGHWDGYAPTSNNYYIHFTDSGEATFLPWGTDQTFDDFRNVHEGYGVLFSRCLSNAACRDAYHGALRRVVDATRALDFPMLHPRQVQVVRPFITLDPRRENDASTATAVQARTLEFILARLADMETLLSCYETANDPDGDGFVCDEDCAPNDPAVYPGAFDSCGDLIDQDCNGWVDDDLSCPDCVEFTINARQYWFCTRERTYVDARAQCQSLGAGVDLAIINDAQENLDLWGQAQALRSQNYWFGLDDNVLEGTFVWSSGQTETEVGFSYWSAGEPNNWGGNENCAHFWSWEPTWNDIPCDYGMGAVCEAP